MSSESLWPRTRAWVWGQGTALLCDSQQVPDPLWPFCGPFHVAGDSVGGLKPQFCCSGVLN